VVEFDALDFHEIVSLLYKGINDAPTGPSALNPEPKDAYILRF
jgi:hypothetical protein